MKTQVTSISCFSYCLLLCLQQVHAVERAKLTNATALNLAAAWDGGAIPGTGDVMLWNNLYTLPSAAGSLSQLGADRSVSGIKVTNVGGSVNVASSLVGFQNTSSANTLTLGAGGIDMSAATQAFVIQSKILLNADQSWTVANANTAASPAGFNNGEDLALHAQAVNTPLDLGGKILTVGGAGAITASSGWNVTNGTLNTSAALFVIQSGNSRLTNLASNLTVNVTGGTFRLQNNSANITSSAAIAVSGGTLEMYNNNGTNTNLHTGPTTLSGGGTLLFNQVSAAPIGVAAVNMAGNANIRIIGGGLVTNPCTISGNITGSGNITYQNTATNTSGFVRLAGDNSGYTGTVTLNAATNNRSLRLTSATAGSAAATWNVGAGNFLQIDGVSVQLGKLDGTGTVTNSSTTAAATANLSRGIFPGVIADGASFPTNVTKVGADNVVLTGANTYTGTTTVSAGTLVTTPLQVGNGTANGPVVAGDGGIFGVLLSTQDTSFITTALTLGSVTGGTLQVDFGSLPNPSVAPVATTNLSLNGPSIVKVIGKNLTTGTFPLIQYANLAAGTVAANLQVSLPTRTTGVLIDNPGIDISLNITGTEQVKWNGNNDDNWDVDPDGLGVTGTPNWRTTVGNAITRYLQGSGGTDVVRFDDTAAGTGTVNLTTTLTPLAVTVNNTPAKNYTFAGSGKLSGLGNLEKNGTGSLTLANTTANDYSGGTVITQGTLNLGDGVTPGAGSIAGSIANEGTLVLNRPDDHDFANPVTGLGTLEKAQTNTVTATANPTLDGPLSLAAGKLRFTAGATLNGVVSGAGLLEAAGGNVTLQGIDPNTNSSPVTVSAGALRLAKNFGVDAVGGDIAITGTGTVAFITGENIPDTATVSHLGTSADCFTGSGLVMETFANAVVTGPVPTPESQMILRAGQTITGTATVNQGILGVASGQTGNVNAVVMTSPTALVRVAGNSAASTMNIGAGGITASAGAVQVKFNTTDQDAILNLSGDVATTGDFAFTNAGYTGLNQNVVNLEGGARTFTIGAATTTTVAPDLAGTGSLVKAGSGTLTLTASCAANPAGGSTVDAGSLLVNGTLAGSVQVNATGTLGGSGSLSGAVVVDGTVAPGAAAAVGTLTSSGGLTLGPDSDYVFQVGNWVGTTPGTDWDHLAASSLALNATPSNPLVIHVTGAPTGFTEVAKTLVIATSATPITGFNAAAVTVEAGGFSGNGTWTVQQTGNTLELVYAASAGTPFSNWASTKGLVNGNNDEGDNPDNDGDNNLVEFATDGEPLSGKTTGKVSGKVATVGGQQVLTLTLPVRGTDQTTPFSGGTEKTAAYDGVQYRIRGGNDLTGWGLIITEVTGTDATAIQSTLPILSDGWTYRTFRTPGPVSGDPKEFIRVLIDPAA